MQALQIAYSPDESKIALGWPTGLIEISAVNPQDGSPDALISQSFFHKKEIVFLAFSSEEEVVSADERGRVSVCQVATGKVLRELDLGGEYVTGGLSPSCATLFVFAYESRHDTNTFAIDVGTFDLTFGPEAKDLSVQSRVFGVNDRRAAFYAYVETDMEDDDTWEGTDRIDESLVFVDFDSGVIDQRALDGGPHSEFGDFPIFAVEPTHGIGVRCAFAKPLTTTEQGGGLYLEIFLEVFDIETFETLNPVLVGGVCIEAGDENEDEVEDHDEDEGEGDDEDDDESSVTDLVGSGSRAQEAYRERVSDLFENLTSLAITGNGKHAWVGYKGGMVRSVALNGSGRSRFVKHGGEPKRGTMSLNEVFARNIINNQTLGVSPRGTYVAFGNPNTFFSAERENLDFDQGALELPARAAAATEAEPPAFLKWVADGDLLVVGTSGGLVSLIDSVSGEVLFCEEVPDGDYLTDASLSPDRRELLLAYGGRNSLRVRFGEDGTEIVELPLPPHTVFAEHVGGDLAVLANSYGAVITVERDTLHAFRDDSHHYQADCCDEDEDEDEGGDEEELEDTELEGTDELEDTDELRDTGEAHDGDDKDGDDDDGEGESEDYEDYDEACGFDLDEMEAEFPWQLKNPDGVEPLMLAPGYDGLFVYNNYFEQAEDVHDVTGCLIGGTYHVLVLLEDGDVKVYRISSERIEPAFTHSGRPMTRIAARGGMVVLTNLDKGTVQVLTWGGDRLEELLSFTETGLRLAALSADGRELFLFNELSGVVSRRRLAEGEEQAVLAYTGPAIQRAFFDPATCRTALVEANGNCLCLDLSTAAGFGNLTVRATTEAREVILSGAPLGAVEEATGPIHRQLESAAESRHRAEVHNREMDLFSPGQRSEEARRLSQELDNIVKRLRKLGDEAYAAEIELLSPLLTQFESHDYYSVNGSDELHRRLGAAFAQRGEALRELGRHREAELDFQRAVGFHYYPAFLSHIEMLTWEVEHIQEALALIERVLIDRNAKQGIGVSKSMPLYRALITCRLRSGDAVAARAAVTHVVESLVTHLEDEASSPELEPLRQDLRHFATTSSLAAELATYLEAALADFPAAVDKDVARRRALQGIMARARFFEMNQRRPEVIELLDATLAPHEGMSYFADPVARGVKHRLGDLWGMRGRARAALGEPAAALADLRRAIDFRDVNRYAEAIELCLFDLDDLDEANALLTAFRECPFHWGSEYWNPFSRRDYAYVLTLGLLADRLRGREGDSDTVAALYAAELPGAAARLHARAQGRPQRFAADSVLFFLGH